MTTLVAAKLFLADYGATKLVGALSRELPRGLVGAIVLFIELSLSDTRDVSYISLSSRLA